MPPKATPPDSKFGRKRAAAKANDASVYENTTFGRRRVGSGPKWVAWCVWALATPFRFVNTLRRRAARTHQP